MATKTIPAELLSLGYLCSVLQQSPKRIEQRLTELGIMPATVINGVKHWGPEAVDALREPRERAGA